MQLSALLSSVESIKTKSILSKYNVNEHILYKHLVILVFALIFGLFEWQMTSMGLVYLLYSIVLVFFNEIFRAKAMQSLEINTLSILMSSSIFIIYGIELLVGREQLDAKNVMGMILFLSAFYLFLDVKLRDFLKINRLGLLYVSGLLIITVIDRPIAKTVFDNE